MFKKTVFVLVAALLFTPLSPSVGLSWHSQPPGPYYYHGGYYNNYGHHDHYDDDVWLWAGGIILGTVLLGALLQQPSPEPERYYSQPQAQVYSYPPYVPPGMCRWERYLRDEYGRFILDQYGQPVKLYTLGSCQYPPPN